MSSGVTQVKKRFAEMSTYLHKDDKGQQLLKLLKDDVNVLRTSLAAANAAKDAAAVSVETARQRADTAEVAAASLAESTRRLQDQLNSLQSQVAILTQQLATKVDPDSEAPTGGHGDDTEALQNRVHSRVYRRLRRLKPKPPALLPFAAIPIGDIEHKFILERNAMAPGWSDHDLWILGAAVAVLCSIDGIVTVLCSDRLLDPKRVSAKRGDELKKQCSPTLSWPDREPILEVPDDGLDELSGLRAEDIVGRRVTMQLDEGGKACGIQFNVEDGTADGRPVTVPVSKFASLLTSSDPKLANVFSKVMKAVCETAK